MLKYFPKEKVRCAPGGNAHGVNPIAWGTYCPGYAKMAGPLGVILQPADCGGYFFGDEWAATAYRFYHVPFCTEPSETLDHARFLKRLFSDASAGATQFFTYEFADHSADLRTYAPLLTGEPAETSVAVYCPTTLYRLGGDLRPTIDAATRLRECTAYDVLDELLIADGALTDRYKALVMFQGEFIDQPILDRIQCWIESGGTLVCPSGLLPTNVVGDAWPLLASDTSDGAFSVGRGRIIRLASDVKGAAQTEEIRRSLRGVPGIPDALDGIWTTRRRHQTIFLNPTTQSVRHAVRDNRAIEIGAGEIAVESDSAGQH